MPPPSETGSSDVTDIVIGGDGSESGNTSETGSSETAASETNRTETPGTETEILCDRIRNAAD
ncbi:MAG: hypothetical protein ACLS5R_04270 [Blautia sp.]